MTDKIQYDLIIKNGTVVLPNETTNIDIGIKDEKNSYYWKPIGM